MSTEATTFADTIIPKSDQLNADDLLLGPITVTITKVEKVSGEQPMVLSITSETREYEPYKPCLSMRRVILSFWGDIPRSWVGRALTVFRNPDTTWAGARVGGIEISHMSDIEKPMSIMLTKSRGKKRKFTVQPLDKQKTAAAERLDIVSDPKKEFRSAPLKPKPSTKPYPDEKFRAALPKIRDQIESGKMTQEQVIAHCAKTGTLTPEQVKDIVAIEMPAPVGSDTKAAAQKIIAEIGARVCHSYMDYYEFTLDDVAEVIVSDPEEFKRKIESFEQLYRVD